jgi:hypothetical protein
MNVNHQKEKHQLRHQNLCKTRISSQIFLLRKKMIEKAVHAATADKIRAKNEIAK